MLTNLLAAFTFTFVTNVTEKPVTILDGGDYNGRFAIYQLRSPFTYDLKEKEVTTEIVKVTTLKIYSMRVPDINGTNAFPVCVETFTKSEQVTNWVTLMRKEEVWTPVAK